MGLMAGADWSAYAARYFGRSVPWAALLLCAGRRSLHFCRNRFVGSCRCANETGFIGLFLQLSALLGFPKEQNLFNPLCNDAGHILSWMFVRFVITPKGLQYAPTEAL